MPRFGYKASEFPDVILTFGKCRGKSALVLRTYRKRNEDTRVCPTNSWIIVQAVQMIR